MTVLELREDIQAIVKSGKVVYVGVEMGGTYCEVSEITFDELAKLNEKFGIDSLDGYDSDNIAIFFKRI